MKTASTAAVCTSYMVQLGKLAERICVSDIGMPHWQGFRGLIDLIERQNGSSNIKTTMSVSNNDVTVNIKALYYEWQRKRLWQRWLLQWQRIR